MSYYVADADGFVADLATNAGLAALYAFVRREGAATALGDLPRQGFSDRPEALALDCERLLLEGRGLLPDVADTLRGLIVAAHKARGILIVSNGEGKS